MTKMEELRHLISGGYSLADKPYRCVEEQVNNGNTNIKAVARHCQISNEMARLAIQTILFKLKRGAGDSPSN